jgi:peroxiredoxin
MVATLCLLGCVLIPGQTTTRPAAGVAPAAPGRGAAAGSGDTLLLPHLSRSQELVYRGTFTEEGQESRVKFSRSYRIETRLFVLDTPPQGADIAVLTILRHRPGSGEPGLTSEATASVRLERVHVDLQGRLTADPPAVPVVPLEGAPTLECGAFIALPGGRVHVGQEWVTTEADRPVMSWKAVGLDLAGGNSCIKLVGEQKSDDWDRPRGDHTAWLRRDTVWLVPRLGLAHRLEREILRREPAHRDPTQRSVLRLEMESGFQMSPEAGDSRRQEITQALAFRDSLTPMLTQPARYDGHLALLLKKIDRHLADQPDTPYRPAIVQVKRRAEAARRGETPPEPVHDPKPEAPTEATPGQLAPDFVATHLTGQGSAQLRRWTGRPVLLVFYHPASATTPVVLRYAQELLAAHPQRLAVVGMSISDDVAKVRKQHADLGLTFPILAAGGLRASYGVESTPKIILLDSANIVRGAYLGWGRETPHEVQEELKRWLPSTVPAPPAPR